jgi:hypothetical protein
MTVYTAIFGGYDRVRRAPEGGGILYTDRHPSVDMGWTVRVVKVEHANLARLNRAYKLQPHLYFDDCRVLYHDGSMALKVPPHELLARFIDKAGGDHDVFTLAHSLGHAARDEAAWVRQKGYVRSDVLRRQVERYRALGMPGDIPGAEPRLVVSRLNDRTRAFFDLWWGEVRDHGHRDQVAFPYAWWATGADVYLVPFRWSRPLYDLWPHVKPQRVAAT